MTRSRSTAGCFTRIVALLLVVAMIAAGAAYISLTTPYKAFHQAVILEFPKGTSTQSMGRKLADAGVIHYPWQFLLARALHANARLMAGEYQFTREASALTVFNRIARGDVFFYEVTVPEGSNIFDIAGIVGRVGFLKSPDFLKAARDPALIRDLDPAATTLEGYLFPSTYRITRSTTVHQLSNMMTEQFRKHWRELQNPGQTADVHGAVTLAALIEKETAVPEERPVVASVYLNRLRQGIKLEGDPTTIYAALLDGRYRGVIHRSDLDSENPYNTYRHTGLPPGPIANPGLLSLKAALAPAQTDYLFFVAKADGSGGHHFSSTMAEHGRAVQDYRRGQAR
jgi:UPF0755 protein